MSLEFLTIPDAPPPPPVSADGSAMKFFMPFNDFSTASVPWDADSCQEYRRLSIGFVEALVGVAGGATVSPVAK